MGAGLTACSIDSAEHGLEEGLADILEIKADT